MRRCYCDGDAALWLGWPTPAISRHRSLSQIHVPLLVPSSGDYFKSLRRTELELDLDNGRILRITVELVGEVSCLLPSEPGLWWGVRAGADYRFWLEVGRHRWMMERWRATQRFTSTGLEDRRGRERINLKPTCAWWKKRPNELFLAAKQPFFSWSKSLYVPLEKDAGCPIPSNFFYFFIFYFCPPDDRHLLQLLNVSYLGQDIRMSVQVAKGCQLK